MIQFLSKCDPDDTQCNKSICTHALPPPNKERESTKINPYLGITLNALLGKTEKSVQIDNSNKPIGR